MTTTVELGAATDTILADAVLDDAVRDSTLQSCDADDNVDFVVVVFDDGDNAAVASVFTRGQ